MLDVTRYSPAIADLLRDDRLPELGPGKPNTAVHAGLRQLTLAAAFPKLQDRDMAQACLAGLWLWHDYLDESHTLSQDLHTAEGSFWHAIMHRREPDAWNSKYWFRRVGQHPVFERLVTDALALGYRYRDPPTFVDFVEQVRGSGSADEELAKRVQRLEWQLLFDHCYQQATGR